MPGEVMAVFDELIRNGLCDTPFSGRIATAILEHLLLKIAETAIPNGSSTSPAFATYQRCRRQIEARWQEFDTLAAIAAACHVDGAYLCRLFRRFDRQSPYQLLLRLKIRHAATLLRSGNTPIAEVADELRFADPFHFSRVFKKFMGISPSAFARMED
jgi:AraC-like DNA-binding protein